MIITLDHYYISPIQEKDAWKLCDFVVSNEMRLKRFFPKTLEQNLNPTLSKIFTTKKSKQFHNKEEFLFTLKEKETNVIAGLIYIKNINWNTKQGEFAYCVGYLHEKKGLIRKSVMALKNHSFKVLGLKTLHIITHKTNLASIKIAQSCHFKFIKTLEKEFTPPGEPALDMELYTIKLA